MKREQYTANGETYVLGEDISREGFNRPVVIEVNRGRGGRGGGHQWRSYQSNYWPRRKDPHFGTYKGYVPQWYRSLREHKLDRLKLIGITAVVSPILFAKLPVVIRLLFQP